MDIFRNPPHTLWEFVQAVNGRFIFGVFTVLSCILTLIISFIPSNTIQDNKLLITISFSLVVVITLYYLGMKSVFNEIIPALGDRQDFWAVPNLVFVDPTIHSQVGGDYYIKARANYTPHFFYGQPVMVVYNDGKEQNMIARGQVGTNGPGDHGLEVYITGFVNPSDSVTQSLMEGNERVYKKCLLFHYCTEDTWQGVCSRISAQGAGNNGQHASE